MQRMIRQIAGILTLIAIFFSASANFACAQATRPASQPASTQPAARLESAAAKLVGRVAGVTPTMTLENLLELGGQSLRDHSYTTALTIFEAILRQDQQNLGAMFGLASAYEAQAQQFANSSDPALSARSPDLKNAAAQWFTKIAQYQSAVGDYMGAERGYLHVLALKPRDYVSQYGLAHVYTATGRRDVNAIEQFGELLRNDDTPTDLRAKAYLELGQVCLRSSLTAQALDALDKALKLDPENAEIYHEMARSHFKRNELPKARKDIETTIAKAQTRPDYRETFALILLAQKDYANARQQAAGAIALGRGALQLRPDDRNLVRALDQYYATFERVMETVLADDPASTTDRVQLIQAIQERATIAQFLALFDCLDVLRRAPATERKNPRLMEQFILINLSLGQLAPAESMARSLLLIEPNNPIALKALQSAQTKPATAPTAR